MKRKPKGIELDPRDPNHALWTWLLADSQQHADIRKTHSRIAKQRDDEYWDNHSKAVAEDHRKQREAWLTDQEFLLTAEEESP